MGGIAALTRVSKRARGRMRSSVLGPCANHGRLHSQNRGRGRHCWKDIRVRLWCSWAWTQRRTGAACALISHLACCVCASSSFSARPGQLAQATPVDSFGTQPPHRRIPSHPTPDDSTIHAFTTLYDPRILRLDSTAPSRSVSRTIVLAASPQVHPSCAISDGYSTSTSTAPSKPPPQRPSTYCHRDPRRMNKATDSLRRRDMASS